MHWISEGDALPKIGQPVLLCSPRQHAEFWDMRVACILVRHEGVVPLPVPSGSEWPIQYYWGSPRGDDRGYPLITGNSWWASFDGINLPPRAIHRHMGPRNDHVILQDGDVWIGPSKSRNR